MRRVLVLIAAAGVVALLLWMQDEDPVHVERSDSPLPTRADSGRNATQAGSAEDTSDAHSYPVDDDPRRIPGPQVVLTGRVERNGQPVPNAGVEARRWDDPIIISAIEADSAGKFRMTIARRPRVVLAAHDDEERRASTFVLIPDKGNLDEVVIQLMDGHAFGGIILNPDGTPHEGATVRLIPDPEWHAYTTETGPDGRFAFPHVKLGEYEVRIAASGFPVIRRFVKLPDVRDFKATLFAGGSIRGRLRDDLERPIGGATITLHSGDGRKSPAGIATVVTNADGSFLMPNVMPGPCWNAVVAHPEWGPRLSNDDDVTLPFEPVRAGEELIWNITLAAGQTLVVRAVAAESGTPLAGALISLSSVRHAWRGEATKPRWNRTDSRGIASFAHTADDGNHIQLEHLGRRIQSKQWSKGEVLLKCELAGVVEGRVRGGRLADQRNHGLRLQWAAKKYDWTPVDCTGHFRFLAVPATNDAVILGHSAHVKSRRFDVVAGERTWVDVDLPNIPAVTGRVVAGNGNPVEGAKVRVVPTAGVVKVVRRAEEREYMWEWAETTNERGEFAVFSDKAKGFREREAESGGKWSLVVLHPDYRPLRKDGLQKPDEDAPQSVAVELRSGESITGAVYFATGQPSPNIPVEALPAGTSPDDQAPRRVMTDSDGKFTLRGLNDGRWDLKAIHGEGVSTPVSARAGARNIRITIEMHPPITGLLLDDEERPIGGALVEVLRYRQSNLTTRTEANGRFRIEHAPPGRHQLRAKPSQWMSPTGLRGSPRFPEFRTQFSDVATDDVVLRAERGTVLSGRVLGADGNPVPHAKVVVAFRKIWMVVANGEGEFSVKDAGGDPVTVYATGAGQPIGVLEMMPGDGMTEIRLPPDGSIRGRVLDSDGRPAVGIVVRAVAEDTAHRIGGDVAQAFRLWARRTATTAKDGTFTIGNIAAGAYKLTIESKDGASATERVRTDGPPVDLRLAK